MLFIYVAGPYSAENRWKRNRNVRLAIRAARDIVQKGHVPFVPHTMMREWEKLAGLERHALLKIGRHWLRKCDALLYLGKSAGADSELRAARKMKLVVFRTIEEIPGYPKKKRRA